MFLIEILRNFFAFVDIVLLLVGVEVFFAVDSAADTNRSVARIKCVRDLCMNLDLLRTIMLSKLDR